MRTFLAALLAPATLLLTGCPAAFQCGAPVEEDTVLRTDGGDAMILCANGGYAVTLADGTIHEGRMGYEDGTTVGTDGTTGARLFALRDAADGTLVSDDLGPGWRHVALDSVELHKASFQCVDVEARAWWTYDASALPVATSFATADGEELLLCPDGSAQRATAAGTETASYVATAGRVSVFGARPFDGVYGADGTLGGTWTRTTSTRLTCGR